MKRRKLLWLGSILAALIVASAVLAWFRSRGPSVALANGNVIQVTGAKVGFTNEFKHGNRFERLFGNAISTNGWKLGDWTLQRAEREFFGWQTNADSLTIEFKITGPTNGPASPFKYRGFDRNYRILHWGEDGFRYTEEYPDRFFRQRRDGYFGYLHTSTYARTSPWIDVEFQNREQKEGEWISVARFRIPNPKPNKVQAWAVQDCPVTNTFGNFTAVLGMIQVQQPRDNVTRYRDIWQHAVEIPFKFFLEGRAVTNWGAEQMVMNDATGNYNFFGAFKSYTNGWIVYRGFRSATPTVPWRLQGHFAEESNFAQTNVFTIRMPINVGMSFATNLAGTKIAFAFATDRMLNAQIPRTTEGQRIILVDVLNERGESINDGVGSWWQYGFITSIDSYRARSNVTVTVALVRNIEFEFVVQPEFVEQISAPSVE